MKKTIAIATVLSLVFCVVTIASAMMSSFECARDIVVKHGKYQSGTPKSESYKWYSSNGVGAILYYPKNGRGVMIIRRSGDTQDYVWYHEGNRYVGYNKDRKVNGKSVYSRPVHISSSEAEGLASRYLRDMGVSCP